MRARAILESASFPTEGHARGFMHTLVKAPRHRATLRWRDNALHGALLSAVLCQVALLLVASWRNRYVFDSDAIPLVRIAWYYATGQFHLAVSGYWGPLFSWLTIPWIGFTEHLLDAGRITAGLSALIFLLGCIAVFRGLHLPPVSLVLATWVTALWTIFYAVDVITADLLMSGLLCLAISRMLSPQWLRKSSTAFMVGLWFGLAYLAKGIAFPVTFVLTLGIAWLWIASRQARWQQMIRSIAFTWLGFALLAGPWIIVLSMKYHCLTVTLSSRVAHTLVGPKDVVRSHPFRLMFHQPEAGRIFSWEEPATLPYRTWSPFANAAYAKRQIEIISDNYYGISNMLRHFDAFGVGIFALLSSLIMPRPWWKRLKDERWRWGIVAVVCLTIFYLPVYSAERRYYFPTYPFLLAASLGLVGWLSHQTRTWRTALWGLGLGLVTVSFATLALRKLPMVLHGLDRPSVQAHELAQRLQAANIAGPIASVGKKEGLFVAFFLNQPWYGEEGEEQPTTVARLKASQAHLSIVDRQSPLIPELDSDPAWRDLDDLLFASTDGQRRLPWKVYQLLTPGKTS